MAQTNSNPSAAEEIRMGVANACLMMPRESSTRREEIERLHHLTEREKELVAEAKDEAGVKDHVKRLNKVFGVSKAALQIMKILDKVGKPGDRAAVLTQVGLLSKDVGYTDKDLVSLAEEAEATAGQGQDEQGSVFDNTPTGSRQGGKDAQPQHVAEKPAEAAPAPTPGLSYDEIVKGFEDANAAYQAKGGKGRKPKALVDAKAALDAANAEREQGATEAPPAAAPGEVGAEMRAGAAEGDAFLRAEADKRKPANDAKPVADDLDDELPPPAPRRSAQHRGLGPDAIH
jgi:hypothetical protein